MTSDESRTTVPREELRALATSMVARTKRYARVLTTWALSTGAAMAILVSGLMAYSEGSMSAESIGVGVIIFVLFGGLVAVAARKYALADLGAVSALVEQGQTFPGRLASDRVVANGIHQLVVLWKEGDKEAGAKFDVDQLRIAAHDRDVTVVSSGGRQVGIVMNGQLYLTFRDSQRFLRWKSRETAKHS